MLETILLGSGALLWIVIGVYVIPQIPPFLMLLGFIPFNAVVKRLDEHYDDIDHYREAKENGDLRPKVMVHCSNAALFFEDCMELYYNYLLKTPYTRLPLF